MQSDPNPDVNKKDVAIERMGILANFNLDSQGVYVSTPPVSLSVPRCCCFRPGAVCSCARTGLPPRRRRRSACLHGCLPAFWGLSCQPLRD